MPIMPQKWVALMACPVKESAELDLNQTRKKTPILPLDASAIVFYATTSGDCWGYAEIVDDEGGALPPIMVLDALSAKRLILTLDSLSYGTTAMASLSKSDTDSNATATRISATPISTDDNDKEETTDTEPGKDSTTLDSPDSNEEEELLKAAAQPIRRQIVISMPEIASMADSFTAGATIQARRVLVNLGLDTQDTNTGEQLVADDGRRERGRDDADYSRPLTGAMPLKNGAVGVRKTAYFGPEAAKGDSHGQDYARGQDKGQEEKKDAKSASSLTLQRHSKTRARPNRLSQRGHQAPTHSQLLDQVQSLMLLKEYSQLSRGHQSLHHRLNGLQQNNNNLPLTHLNNTTLSGKVAMVLMSTVCGIGVGMFGALLFVVALKVRLFRSRRSSNSGSNLHPLRHPTAAQQQQAHQQMRESGLKKVIPLGVLESYGVQTVLQTSEAAMVLTAVSEKYNAKMALLSKGAKAVYAEDVIEMEEGLEDVEARANARRLRLERRRNGVGGGGQLPLGRDIEEEEGEEFSSDTDDDDYDDDDDVNEDVDQADQDGYQDHGQYEEEENDDQVVPEMRFSRDGGAMDMEQITTAIMTATRQGSYRRVSYSRQGHLNDSTSSLSSSYSSPSSSSSSYSSPSSSSSSSSGSSSSASSSSMERALTSSFSSSLSRSENPQGCTHSITHSHERRSARSNRRRKMKGDKALKEMKKSEKLPFANANAQTMCSICLAEYEVGEQVRTLPCYHQYHQACIDPWLLNVAALCPICKRDLFPSPLMSSYGSAGASSSS
ncbi:hypothetical protein BG015_002661 [Linnemannia schmuckeri]|uniref:RING-type domain-containing protein n=1 Tax=Linnemannia schmuckeri TaxID=64567 RepID=A0A9P5RRU2_9FUNG|nr:hypothetical protein BG015_002661 [Linnemannia schmuckeri]